eukprot:gene17471-24175_t
MSEAKENSFHSKRKQGEINDSTGVEKLKNGVVFYSFMNNRKKFYLPNIENYFGPVKVEKIMIDTGCNSLLLNFKESKQINDLIDAYPSSHQSRKMTDFRWRIGKSSDVGGTSPVLIIEMDPSQECINVSLMTDEEGEHKFKLFKLRFALCTEDIEFMLNLGDLLKTIFTQDDVNMLNQLVTGDVFKRRTHALLGQDILQRYSCIRHGKVALYIDVLKMEEGKFDWIDIKDCCQATVTSLKHLPDDFNDWEDDDLAHGFFDDFEDNYYCYDPDFLPTKG